jgi:GDP-4-dehydro-6-deoxy-D-mannose reductase
MPPRRVLVTGASGFVGAHLLRLLEASGEVEVFAWTRDVIPDGPRATWLVLEMADREAVAAGVSEARPDLVYHLAGAAHVGHSFGAVADTLASNAIGTAHLLDALRLQRVRARTLVVSSSTVYAPSETALDEQATVRPSSPYGLSKLAQEMLALRACHEDDLDVVVVRSFNHVGPGQAPSFFAPAFAKQIAEAEAGLREPVLRVGNLDARRDLTDVRDTVRAYRLLLERGERGGVYNMCSGRAYGVREILDELRRIARIDLEVGTDPALLRPSDNSCVLGSHARLTRATGWVPEIPIERSIHDLLESWRDRVSRRAAR